MALQQEEPIYLKKVIFNIGTNAVHGLSSTEREKRLQSCEPNRITQNTTKKHIYKIDKAIYECCKLIHMNVTPKSKPNRFRKFTAIFKYTIQLRCANLGIYCLIWSLILSFVGMFVDNSVPSANFLNFISLIIYTLVMLLARFLYILFVHKKTVLYALYLTVRPTIIPFETFVRSNGYQDVFSNVGENVCNTGSGDENGNYDYIYMFDLFVTPELEKGRRIKTNSSDKKNNIKKRKRKKKQKEETGISPQNQKNNPFMLHNHGNNASDDLDASINGNNDIYDSHSPTSSENVIKIKDSFQHNKNISTLSHLLSHSQGISSHNSIPQYNCSLDSINVPSQSFSEFYSINSSNISPQTFSLSMEHINFGECDVLIDDNITKIKCSDIVLGDIIVLSSGDVVPSDCMLLPVVVINGTTQQNTTNTNTGAVHNNKDIVILADMVKSVSLVGFSDYCFGTFIESYVVRPDDRECDYCSPLTESEHCHLKITDFVHKQNIETWGDLIDNSNSNNNENENNENNGDIFYENSVITAPSFTLLAGMTIKSIQLNINSRLEIKDPKSSVKILAVTIATGRSLLINQYIELFDVITNFHTMNELEEAKQISLNNISNGDYKMVIDDMVDEDKINKELTTKIKPGLSLIDNVLNNKCDKDNVFGTIEASSGYTDCLIGSSVDCGSEGSPLLQSGDIIDPKITLPLPFAKTLCDSSIKSPGNSINMGKTYSSIQTTDDDYLPANDMNKLLIPSKKISDGNLKSLDISGSDVGSPIPFFVKDSTKSHQNLTGNMNYDTNNNVNNVYHVNELSSHVQVKSGTQSTTPSEKKTNISSQREKRINEKILKINKELEEAIEQRQEQISKELNQKKQTHDCPRYLKNNLIYSAKVYNRSVYRILYILSLISCLALPFVPLIYNVYNTENLEENHIEIRAHFEGNYILSCYLSIFAVFFITLATRYDNPINLSLYNIICSNLKKYLITANKRLNSIGRYSEEADLENVSNPISSERENIEVDFCLSTTATNEPYCSFANKSTAFSDNQSIQMQSGIIDSMRSNQPLLPHNSSSIKDNVLNEFKQTNNCKKLPERNYNKKLNPSSNGITFSNILAMNSTDSLVIDISRFIDAIEINRIYFGFNLRKNFDLNEYRGDIEAYCENIITTYNSKIASRYNMKKFRQMAVQDDPFGFYDYNDKLGLISEVKMKQKSQEKQLSWLHSHISNNRNMLLLAMYSTLTPKEKYMLYKIYTNNDNHYIQGIPIQKPELTPREKLQNVNDIEIDTNFSILLNYSSFANVVTIYNIISNRTYGNFSFHVYDIFTYPMQVYLHVITNTTYYKKKQGSRYVHSRTQSTMKSFHDTNSMSMTSNGETSLLITVRSPDPYILQYCKYYSLNKENSNISPFKCGEMTCEIRNQIQKNYGVESDVIFQNLYYAYYYGPIHDADMMFFEREQMSYNGFGPKKVQFDISKYPLTFLGHAFGIVKPNPCISSFMDRIYGDSQVPKHSPTPNGFQSQTYKDQTLNHQRSISLVLHSKHDLKHSLMILRTLGISDFITDKDLREVLNKHSEEEKRDESNKTTYNYNEGNHPDSSTESVYNNGKKLNDDSINDDEITKLINSRNKNGKTNTYKQLVNEKSLSVSKFSDDISDEISTSLSKNSSAILVRNNVHRSSSFVYSSTSSRNSSFMNMIGHSEPYQLDTQGYFYQKENNVDISFDIFENSIEYRDQECLNLLIDSPKLCKNKMEIRNRNLQYLKGFHNNNGVDPSNLSKNLPSSKFDDILNDKCSEHCSNDNINYNFNMTDYEMEKKSISSSQNRTRETKIVIPHIFISGIKEKRHNLPTYNNRRKCMVMEYDKYFNKENLDFFFTINKANNSKTSQIDNYLIALIVNTPQQHNLYEVINETSNAIIVENRQRETIEKYDDDRDYGNIVYLPPNRSKYSIENNYKSSLMLLALLDIIFESQLYTANFAVLSNYINKVNVTINSLPIYNIIIIIFGTILLKKDYTSAKGFEIISNYTYVYNSIFLVGFVLVTRLVFQQLIPLLLESILPNEFEHKVKKLLAKIPHIKRKEQTFPNDRENNIVNEDVKIDDDKMKRVENYHTINNVNGSNNNKNTNNNHNNEGNIQSIFGRNFSFSYQESDDSIEDNNHEDIYYYVHDINTTERSYKDNIDFSIEGENSYNLLNTNSCCQRNECSCCRDRSIDTNKRITDNKLLYKIQHVFKKIMDKKFNARITIIYLALTIIMYSFTAVILSSDAIGTVSYRYLPSMSKNAFSSYKTVFEIDGDNSEYIDLTVEQGEQSTVMLLLLFTVGGCVLVQLLIITVNTFIKIYVMDFSKTWQRADMNYKISSYDKNTLKCKYTVQKIFMVLALLLGVMVVYYGICIIYPISLAIWGGNVPGSGLTVFNTSKGWLFVVVLTGEVIKEAVYSIKEFNIIFK